MSSPSRSILRPFARCLAPVLAAALAGALTDAQSTWVVDETGLLAGSFPEIQIG